MFNTRILMFLWTVNSKGAGRRRKENEEWRKRRTGK
jgi:hypothetical protein